MTEREQTEYFLKITNIGDITDLKNISNDPPDFSLQLNDNIISIEHTRYFVNGGEKIKARDVLKQKIKNRTYEIYEERYSYKLALNFQFEKKNQPSCQ